MDALLKFCLPDFGKCRPGLNEVGPAVGETIKYITDCGCTKAEPPRSTTWQVDPVCFCWKGDLLLGIEACCCGCCAAVTNCRNLERVTGKSCEAQVCICCVLHCCCMYPCYRANARKTIRDKYNLSGSGPEDCIFGCCCLPCAICQEASELMKHESDYIIPLSSKYFAAGPGK